jgi:hypothetical protein
VRRRPFFQESLKSSQRHLSACHGLKAADVVAQIPVSRSVLQRRFRKELGRSLQEEIIQARMKRARQLLAETDLSLVEVAGRVQAPGISRRDLRGEDWQDSGTVSTRGVVQSRVTLRPLATSLHRGGHSARRRGIPTFTDAAGTRVNRITDRSCPPPSSPRSR